MFWYKYHVFFFFFSSRRRHTRWTGDWSSDVCSSDLPWKEYSLKGMHGSRMWNCRRELAAIGNVLFEKPTLHAYSVGVEFFESRVFTGLLPQYLEDEEYRQIGRASCRERV